MKTIAPGALALMLGLGACGDGDASPARGAPAAGSDAIGHADASAPARGAVSESRSFRDWYATCDNGGACVAFSGGSTGWLRIGLEAGPDARPSVMLGIWPGDEAARDRPVFLVIDGRRHAASPGAADSGSHVIAAAETPGVLAALARASAVQVTAGGEDTVEIPPAGASAALLWIDERQGRLGTTTALIRRGDAPASRVPAAPDLPVVTAAPAVSQAGFAGALDPLSSNADYPAVTVPAALEALPAVRQCRENTAFNAFLQKAVTASRLDRSTELWGVPCDSGAYNATYLYFLTGPNGADPRPAGFPEADGAVAPPTEGDPDGLINPAYDPATRTLTAFSKARGLGDCGALQTWTWTGRGFVMSREQVMGECWGMVSDLWPTTWRTR